MKVGNKEIIHLAFPALLSLAVDPLVSIVDTAFVSGLGTVKLGALGVSTPIFFVAFLVSNFLAYGTTPLISEALGLNKEEEAKRVSTEALIVAVVMSIVVLIALLFGRHFWLDLMGAGRGEMHNEAVAYLSIRAFAAPAVFLITASNGIFRGYEDTRTPLYVTLLVNGLNVVLDTVLILGFGWGLVGAASATLVAQWVGAICFVFLLFRKHCLMRLSNLRFRLFFRLGWVLGLRTISIVGTMAVAASAATRIGVSTVAAHQVVLQIWLLWALLIDSVAVAAQIMVPRVLAAGDEEQVKELLRLLWGWGVLGGCLLGLLTVPLIYILPQWFSTEPEVISNIRSAMLILVVLQPIGGIVFVGDGIFLGAKRFGFLAASCATGGLLAFPVLLFACDTLLAVWVVILGFVSFRALAMGAYFYRTGGKLVYTAPDGVG